MSEFVTVAQTSDIPAGEGRALEVNGRHIAVFNCEGTFYAIDNTCVHAGGPLGEGLLEGTQVTCPWHAWTYDVTSGQCTFNPAARVESYQVQVDGDDIKVAI